MAWTTPRTWVTGELVDAALMNAQVRDNLNETEPAKVTTNGDLVYLDGSDVVQRLAIGAANDVLSWGPSWGAAAEGPVLGAALYDPQPTVTFTTTTSYAMIDSTNISVTFTVPSNGEVWWLAQIPDAAANLNTAGTLHLAMDNTSGIDSSTEIEVRSFAVEQTTNIFWKRVTGLTPSASVTWRLAAKHTSTAQSWDYGIDSVIAKTDDYKGACGFIVLRDW